MKLRNYNQKLQVKKIIVMISRIALSVLLLFLNSNNTYSQRLDTIEVSNSKEKDKLEISVLSYFETNTLCLKIEKTLPIAKFENKSDFKSEYIYQIPNSQKAIIHLFFIDSKFVRGTFEKKAMRRIFNNGFQKKGTIEKKNITIDKLNIEGDNIEGVLKIQLPFAFGWLDSDTLVKVNFKTRILHKPVKQILNPGFVQSYSIKPNLIDNIDEVYYEPCSINKDTLNVELNLKIGSAGGMGGSLVYIKISEESEKIEITSYDYSDIEDDESYHYPYYKLEFNHDPFKESDIPLIGKYLIATDSLPNKYGDQVVRSGFFKCK
ncbi:hypothetical protein EO244_10215 [Ancylomarina salipaludis]|uniref:Uncharacterized protein n=1 Tax=Ancylomarina salipaludis TaxID=2501299 RepID=A0A4Q1JL52_9BACT|nr:hypothetical protein [Ancylomarina salipaludis]RXQ93942.1 hypothetical protein EO244_10215 [Ancylomarina salipaludis]